MKNYFYRLLPGGLSLTGYSQHFAVVDTKYIPGQDPEYKDAKRGLDQTSNAVAEKIDDKQFCAG